MKWLFPERRSEVSKRNNKTAENDIFVRDRYEMEYLFGLLSDV